MYTEIYQCEICFTHGSEFDSNKLEKCVSGIVKDYQMRTDGVEETLFQYETAEAYHHEIIDRVNQLDPNCGSILFETATFEDAPYDGLEE